MATQAYDLVSDYFKVSQFFRNVTQDATAQRAMDMGQQRDMLDINAARIAAEEA